MSALASGESSASQATDWDRYKLSDDEFSVLLPTVPGMSSYRVSRELSSQSILRHVIGAYAEGVAYVVYVFERKQSLDEFIANFRYSSASNFERNLEVSGVRGKAYVFINDERRGSTYFLATKSRIYVFEAQGSLLGNPDLGIPKFLESINFGVKPLGPSDSQWSGRAAEFAASARRRDRRRAPSQRKRGDAQDGGSCQARAHLH